MNKEYQEALDTLTDWFHSYVDDKGITVHERHITPKYETAEKTIRELIEAFEILKNKLELKTTVYRNGGPALEYYYDSCFAFANKKVLRCLSKEEYEILQKVIKNE
mgnify:CR=1 FL=1